MGMTYSQAVTTITTLTLCGESALVLGDAGIGKSQMMKSVAERVSILTGLNVRVFTLFGSLIKEGECGGIPVPYATDNDSGEVFMNYAKHVLLKELIDFCNEDKEHNFAILFIDEINRCELPVQHELMQIILDKKINTTIIPDNCAIHAAGNPRATDANDYQVYEMNPALLDRFFIINLDVNVQEWLAWALAKKDTEDYVHEDVIEFIAEYPQMLSQPDVITDCKPTPRGWYKYSVAIKISQEWFPDDEDNIHRLGKAKVGDAAALAFIQFTRNKENPLVKPEEIFESKEEDFEKALERIKKESGPRLYVTSDKIITYITNNCNKFEKSKSNAKKSEKTKSETMVNRLIKTLNSFPKDFMIGIFKDLVDNHKEVYNTLIEHEEFIDVFMNVYKRTVENVNIVKDN